jgi:RNA polymerase sigma factor (sigma-70 family)
LLLISDVKRDYVEYDELFERDSQDLYLAEVRMIPLLTKEEEKALAYEMRNGNKAARNKFIESNLRLVLTVARMYKTDDVSMKDLIAEGNTGLITAVDRFDPDKGFRFSTYAFHWIRYAVRQSIYNQTGVVRRPPNIWQGIHKYSKIYNRLFSLRGVTPSDSEIAEIMNVSVEAIKKLKTYAVPITSLNVKLNDEDDESAELMDVVVDDKHDVENGAINNVMRTEVRELFKKCNLKEKEIAVLKLYYGFDDEPKTFKEIGEILGVTYQRVEQIHQTALKRIRLYKITDSYAVYMDNPEIVVKKLERMREIYKKGYSNPYRSRAFKEA